MLPEACPAPPVSSPLPPSPDAIMDALREANPNAARLVIACAFVLHHPDTNALAAYALVSDGSSGIAFAAGAEICVQHWPVVLLSTASPIGHAVTSPPAGLGDCVTVRLPGGSPNGAAYEAQIVSWNGSPVLIETERDDCREKQEKRVRDAQSAEAEQRRQAALRAKEDGVVANLRARRLAVEAALRNA